MGFQPLLIIYNFVVILFSVSNMHTFALHMWSRKTKTFFIQNSLFINAWDSRILKEKRQKKNNKKQTDHPPVFTAIVLLIARMCPFKFFLIITNKNNNQFKEKPTKKYIFSIFCLFFKKRENDTTIGNRNKKN